MANKGEARNEIIKNVEIYWAKLHKAVDPFGELQYEAQIRFPKKRVEEMEQYGKVKEVKDAKGVFFINLKKKAEKADGTEAAKVKVVDIHADPVDPRTIGNGSKGNVKVMLRDYEIKNPKTGKVTKSGTSVMLVAVQITDLVVYTPKTGIDFDYVSDEDGNAQEIPEDAYEDEEEQEEEEAPRAKQLKKAVAVAAKASAGKKPVAPLKKGPGRPKKVQDEDEEESPF